MEIPINGIRSTPSHFIHSSFSWIFSPCHCNSSRTIGQPNFGSRSRPDKPLLKQINICGHFANSAVLELPDEKRKDKGKLRSVEKSSMKMKESEVNLFHHCKTHRKEIMFPLIQSLRSLSDFIFKSKPPNSHCKFKKICDLTYWRQGRKMCS